MHSNFIFLDRYFFKLIVQNIIHTGTDSEENAFYINKTIVNSMTKFTDSYSDGSKHAISLHDTYSVSGLSSRVASGSFDL